MNKQKNKPKLPSLKELLKLEKEVNILICKRQEKIKTLIIKKDIYEQQKKVYQYIEIKQKKILKSKKNYKIELFNKLLPMERKLREVSTVHNNKFYQLNLNSLLLIREFIHSNYQLPKSFQNVYNFIVFKSFINKKIFNYNIKFNSEYDMCMYRNYIGINKIVAIDKEYDDAINRLQKKYNLYLETLDIELYSSKNISYNYIIKEIYYDNLMRNNNDYDDCSVDYSYDDEYDNDDNINNWSYYHDFLVESTFNYDDYKLYKTKKYKNCKSIYKKNKIDLFIIKKFFF